MTPYEERLDKDLAAIRERIVAIGSDVEEGLRKSVRALLTNDRDLAAQVVLDDLAINRAVRRLDRRTHKFVALHLPSAGHLRFVSSILRLNLELERVGDYAVAIAREALQLPGPPPEGVAKDIELMAEQAERMLNQALRSFHEANPDLARGTKTMSDQVEATFEKVHDDLLQVGAEGKMQCQELFALHVVFSRLGRVSDQAKNICEETIFAATGETKTPKVYRVLFLDETNSCRSQMAEAIARKAFPESGSYQSAGWRPAQKIDPAFAAFMDSKGHSMAGVVPKQLDMTRQELGEFHVIVSLQDEPREHIPEIPFHTIPLRWGIEKCPEGGEGAEEKLAETYREIAGRVEELMVALRGDEAG